MNDNFKKEIKQKETLKKVLKDNKAYAVEIKEKPLSDGANCVIAFDDGLKLCVEINGSELFAPIEEGDTVRMSIVFTPGDDEFRTFICGKKKQKELKALFQSGDGIEVYCGAIVDDDGTTPMPYADVAGKVLSIEKIYNATVFTILCCGKEFLVVHHNHAPKVAIGDILFGNYEIVGYIINKNLK